MHRLLAWLVPSSALHWDRLRPLTARRSLAELIDEVEARQQAAVAISVPPWNHRYPEPWDDGSTPRCLP